MTMMKRKCSQCAAVVGVVLGLVALVSALYHLGRRAGAKEVEANTRTANALSSALRVRTDIEMARALQSTNCARVVSDLEGDMFLHACLLGIDVSLGSTDADTANDVHKALADLDRYIADHPSAVLTNRRALPMIQQSKEKVAAWMQALTNAPRRARWGIAFDRKTILAE
ncbi:MAG: hypothetical protein PHR35_16010 [Kiritimatiellae bacterium]|nr:hypothetical protein [Kiritimatiellia bacterium]